MDVRPIGSIVSIIAVWFVGVTAAVAQPAKNEAPRPATQNCNVAAAADELIRKLTISVPPPADVAHGNPVPVQWTLPPASAGPIRLYLVAAMPDVVRFDGAFTFDDTGMLAAGPGFIALPGGAKAPHGIAFGADRTRVVIPVHDTDVPRTAGLHIKPYVAGPLAIDWAAVAVATGCGPDKRTETSIRPIGRAGPYTVGVAAATIVVQDFAAPSPGLELATAVGTQRLTEVEVTADGRWRLEIFNRRWRLFDRATGAKVADRSGVKPRFSPGGRFVIASVGDATQLYPTSFEIFDVVAGRIVSTAQGPIVGWSNGDALLVDAGRAYRSVGLFNTLVDPVRNAEGHIANWPIFFPGCGTCDAWTGSNLRFDWDRLTVLHGDDETPRAKGMAVLASGKVIDVMMLDEEAKLLREMLRRHYGPGDVRLTKGWTSTAGFVLTHVGRGYEGYVDDGDSLQPADKGRANQTKVLAPRRLALAGGKVLAPRDLGPMATTRTADRAAWRSTRTGGAPKIESGTVADELAKFDLFLLPTQPVAELPIPIVDGPSGHDPLVRIWPDDLKQEIAAADPALSSWFAKDPDDIQEKIVVAAWRFERDGRSFLLLQHGDPAPTTNGAHQLRFDLVTTAGPDKGRSRTIDALGGLYSQFVGREFTVARVFQGDGERLLVAVPGTGKAVALDVAGSAEPETIDLVEPTLLCALLEIPARGMIVQSNCDGQFFVFAPKRSKTALLRGHVQDEELVLYTANGYYAATYEGAHFVHVAFPGRLGVHSFEQFAKVLDRPDIIRGILDARGPAPVPPVLRPPPEVTAERTTEGVAVRASSATGLVRLELHEDGRRTATANVTGPAATLTLRPSGRSHVRRLTVVAVDSDGFVSRPVTIDALPARKGENRLFLIGVGIDDYTYMARLRGARHDAETLAETLSQGTPYYGDVHVALQVDRGVSPNAMLADIEAATSAAGPDDTIVFFYAGHGGRTDDGRFVMTVPDTDPDRLAETGIEWQTISAALDKARGRVIVVIDACHSGQTGRTRATNDDAVASLARTTTPMVIFAASKGRQLSEEWPGGAGGIFTQTLARVLSGSRAESDTDGDGLLSIAEVYAGVKRSVETATAGRQTPWLVRRGMVGDVPLF